MSSDISPKTERKRKQHSTDKPQGFVLHAWIYYLSADQQKANIL